MTQLLTNPDFEGGGAAPTSWTQPSASGTSTPVASIYGDGAVAYEHVAAAQRPYFNQTTASLATGTYTLSAYVETVSGSVQVNNFLTAISLPTGASVAYPDGSTTLLAAGQRVRATITIGATAGTATVRVGLGVSSNATGTVRFSRPQLVTGSQPGDYCPTGTCAAETATVATPADLSTDEGCAHVCVTPSWTGNTPASAVFLDGASATTTARFAVAISGDQTFRAQHSAGSVSLATTYTSGVRRCYLTQWSGGSITLTDLTSGSTTTASATFSDFGAALGLGHSQNSGAAQANASLDTIRLGSHPNGCQ